MPDGKKSSEVKHNGLIGYVDANGKLMGPGAVFESVEPLEGNAMLVKVKGKYGVADYSCTYIVKPELESVEIDLSIPGYIRVTKGSKAGLLRADNAATVMAPDQYNALEPFHRYWKVKKGDKTGLVDIEHNSVIVKPEYEDVMLPVSIDGVTYIPVAKKGDWGVINSQGKQVLKCKYKDVSPVNGRNVFLLHYYGGTHNLYDVHEDRFVSIAMDNAETVGPFTIQSGLIEIPHSSSSPADIRIYKKFNDGHFVMITDKDGKVVSTDNVTVKQTGNFYALTKDNSDTGDIYTAAGKLLVTDVTTEPEKAGSALVFGNKLITASEEVFDCKKTGDVIFVRQPDRLWHIMTDNVIAPDGYEEVITEDNGIAGVKKDGKWGVVYNGKETIACESPSPLEYDKDIMGYRITKGDKQGIRKPDGTVLFEPKYDEIIGNGKEYNYEVRLNGKKGIVSSTDGSVIFPPEYDFLTEHGDFGNVLLHNKGDLYGVARYDGTIFIPVKYKNYAIHLIEDEYYEVLEGGGITSYYNSDGEKLKEDRRVTVTEQWLEHNVYDDNNNKCIKVHFNFDTQFQLECPIYVEAKVYNANGKVAVNRYGQQIKHGYWITPTYLFSSYTNRWITFPNSQFKQPKGTKRDYYIKLTFRYDNDSLVPTTGNDKMPFIMTN